MIQIMWMRGFWKQFIFFVGFNFSCADKYWLPVKQASSYCRSIKDPNPMFSQSCCKGTLVWQEPELRRACQWDNFNQEVGKCLLLPGQNKILDLCWPCRFDDPSLLRSGARGCRPGRWLRESRGPPRRVCAGAKRCPLHAACRDGAGGSRILAQLSRPG